MASLAPSKDDSARQRGASTMVCQTLFSWGLCSTRSKVLTVILLFSPLDLFPSSPSRLSTMSTALSARSTPVCFEPAVADNRTSARPPLALRPRL